MIVSVTVNPCVDHTLFVPGLHLHDTNRVQRTETDAGGKGVNLSRVAVELGVESVATGFLGGGPGAFVRKVLDRQGVTHHFVDTLRDTRTNVSIEDGDGPPTTLNERGPEIEPAEWEYLVATVRFFAAKASWVALGGSLPPGLPADAFRTLCEVSRSAGAKVLLDADGDPQRHGLLAGPDLIKPNAAEAGRLLGKPVQTLDAAADAARDLRTMLAKNGANQPVAIVSRGSDGAVMACAEGVFSGAPIPVQVRSTIGSGDSLLGGYLAGLEQGLSQDKALALGLAAGAATATTDGASIARREVIDSLLPMAKVERIGGI